MLALIKVVLGLNMYLNWLGNWFCSDAFLNGIFVLLFIQLMHVSVKQNNLIENTKENLSLKTTEKEGEKQNFFNCDTNLFK